MRTRRTGTMCLGVILTLGAVLLVPPGAAAQAEIDQSRRSAIVRSIETAAPAVVSINVVQIEAHRLHGPLSRDFWDLFHAPAPHYHLRERQVDSVGSGFFFDDQGHIVTNYHVIEGAESVASVGLPDGRVLEVDLVGVDERTDLAVLRARGNNLPRLPLGDSDALMRGEWAIAIGNPFGVLIQDPEPTVSVGVVSANHRRVNRRVGGGERLYQDLIQTDAAINPGNSGGPLVNARGEAIGVNTMIFSPSGGSVGLGFAIPINRVKRIVAEIIQYGHRRDPWAGFRVEDVTALRADLRRDLEIRVGEGAFVVNILTNCPAYDAGLRPGDIILEMNGKSVTTASDVDFGLWGLFVDDAAELHIDRKGARSAIRFKIRELEE